MHSKTTLLNRSATHQIVLAVLAEKRPHLAAKFNRISGDFFTAIERDLVAAIAKRIETAPTVGKTLKLGIEIYHK